MAALELGAFDFVAKPVGGTVKENRQVLQHDLRPRVEAFARIRHVRKILHGQGPPPSFVSAKPPSTDNDDVARRMRRVVDANRGRTEVVAIGISTGGPQTLNRMLPQPASGCYNKPSTY